MLEQNSSGTIWQSGTIGGNLEVYDNTGGLIVSGNTIGGNLECEGNLRPPFSFTVNTVGGNKEGQCAFGF